jgi:hypothetical protein
MESICKMQVFRAAHVRRLLGKASFLFEIALAVKF